MGSVKRVLFLAAEVSPFVKAGGLADVAGTLPKVLAQAGIDVRIVLPHYKEVADGRFDVRNTGRTMVVRFGGKEHPVRILTTTIPGTSVPVYFLDQPTFFADGSLYLGEVTDAREQERRLRERFLFLAQAAVELPQALNWWPQVVHCHDWHVAMHPLLLQVRGRADPRYRNMATLFTIHNLPLQGSAEEVNFQHLLGLREEDHPIFTRWKSTDYINFDGLGILTADQINTVSPSYAQEILTPEYGAGLQALLTERRNDLCGILNGIDTDEYDPEKDPLIAEHFSSATIDGKERNASWLRGNAHIGEGPIFGLVSRLTNQKGIDLLAEVIPDATTMGARFVLLGTGEPPLEARLRELAAAHPAFVSVTIGFDADYAHRIYAGSHFFLMPSRFEPCGLGQMIALRYGTLPIVHATGGLRDTVVDGETGFAFRPDDAAQLRNALHRAATTYADTPALRKLQTAAMAQDFSWTRSARQYLDLYERTVAHHAAK